MPPVPSPAPRRGDVLPGGTSSADDVFDVFSGGGEAGRLMAAVDWAATPLGPVASWPAGLRNTLRTVLASRFPMVLTWGPEFRQFYNDAYAPLIGAKHPAIGEDIRVTLAEGWDVLGPPVEHAMATREASWLPRLPLLLERAGYREETYFTVSHAPAFDDDGRVGGMHAVCTEVTGEVLAARRQRLLHDLSTAAGGLSGERELVRRMCRTLADAPLDVPFAAVWLATGDGRQLERVAGAGCDLAALPPTLPAGLPATTGPLTVDDAGTAGPDGAAVLARAVRELGLVGGLWQDPVTDALLLPLAAVSGGAPVGVLLAARSPNRALDDEYRSFYELLAAQFAGAVANARAYETERRRAESLAELDRAKTTFFSDVSHELRTPLTLLLGPVRDVLDDPGQPLPDAVREQLELAMRNGQRLQRLVNDLLDFAGIEAGRAHPVRVRTDLAAFTGELAGIFRAAAERAGLRLTVDCPPLPSAAYVDPRMWEKVVVNLLSNAVKYTFVGGIDVALRADGDRIALTVADTGVGIPAEELPHLFQRFHRVSGATARTREGTGIGLALVHELVALHGGGVTVESEPGTGSRFTVRLPFGAPDAAPEAAGGPGTAPTPSEAARGEAASWEEDTARPVGAAASSAAQAVLVVDDNADMRAYLTRLLAPLWRVRTTANGEEALAAIAAERPDVVLTDVMMPRMDGFELLQALRADPVTRPLPVVVLTARAGQEAAVEGLEAGADDYLAKPFRAPELIARLRVVLDRVARRAEAGDGPDAGPAPGGAPPPPAHAAGAVDAARTVDAAGAVDAARTEPGRGPAGARATADAGATADAVDPADGRVAWRLPSDPRSVPVLRRRLRAVLQGAGVDADHAYDLLLAACEAATNAIEHAQEPTQPFVDVTVEVDEEDLRITVRDHGQWRERTASLDRGRGSTLMSAVGEITATRSPEGTTVVIRTPRNGAARPSTAC